MLDGQQRLTSLYQAFYGIGEHRYFLDLTKLRAEEELESCFFYLRANEKAIQAHTGVARQAATLTLPLSEIFGASGGFDGWRSNVRKENQALGDKTDPVSYMAAVMHADEIDEFLATVNRDIVERIVNYRFPVVTLSANTEVAAVCTIFETLNRTGVKLGVFELLTARFWKEGINLRKLWQETQDDPALSIIADFEIDPYYLLQAISLVSNDPPACKRSDVLNLKADAVGTWWAPVAAGMADGLRLLQQECGVIGKQWLPVYPLLVTLAAVLTKPGLPSGPANAVARIRLVRWFWCTVLSGKYESGPNSQAVKDVTELPHWVRDGGPPPESVSLFRFERRTLRETTFRQRQLYKALICLVLSGGPRDFHTGERLTPELIVERQVDDHHIFPSAYLATAHPSLPPRVRDSILNRTLIGKKTNIVIGKKAPSIYLTEIRTHLEGSLDSLLESHLMPAGESSPLLKDDFDGFFAERDQRLWDAIVTATGLQSDPEGEDVLEG